MCENKEKLLNLVSELADSSSESDSDTELYEFFEDEAESVDDELLLSELCNFSEKGKRNCIKNYVEEIVPTYTEVEFRRHFRISKSLFENLCEKFGNSGVYQNLRADKRLTPHKNMAVFLWFAGHEACSFRDLADRFDLSCSTVCCIVSRITMFISSLSTEIIKWPNENQKQETARFFKNKAGIPKAIGNVYAHVSCNFKSVFFFTKGCIDGTHIVIDPPDKSKDDYIDRKGLTSLVLQAICNEQKKFINIFVGFPGSSHDSWVLQNSPIHSQLTAVCGGNIVYYYYVR